MTGAAGAALPYTGLRVGWMIIAAFTLIALGLALLRLVPRRKE